jgi:hypothetical protein
MAGTTKKPTAAPRPAGDTRQKPSAANRGDDLDTDSVVIVEEKKGGAKDKGKHKASINQKRPGTDNNRDKPNR